MTEKMDVPENFKYVLDRGSFEYNRAVSNASFLADAHLSDKDASFLDGELFKRVMRRAEDACAQEFMFRFGTLLNLFPEDECPREYWFSDNNRLLIYTHGQARGVAE